MYEVRSAIKKAQTIELAVLFFNNMTERGLSIDEIEAMQPFAERASKELFTEKKIIASRVSHEINMLCFKHKLSDREELSKVQLRIFEGEKLKESFKLFQLLGIAMVDFLIPTLKLIPNQTVEALTPEFGGVSLSDGFLEQLNVKGHELGIGIEFRKGQHQCFWFSKLSAPALVEE